MHIRSIYLCVCVCILGSSLSLLCFVSFFFLSERERERVRYTDQKQNKKTWLKKRRERKSKREGNEDPRAGGMVIMMILYPCPTPHALRHEEGPLRRRTHHVRIRPKQKKKGKEVFLLTSRFGTTLLPSSPSSGGYFDFKLGLKYSIGGSAAMSVA